MKLWILKLPGLQTTPQCLLGAVSDAVVAPEH